ncbi:MAG: PCRF domain-containing protein, partial [Dongia sp.]
MSALNEKLDRVAKRYDEIAALLASEGPKDAQSFARLSKEYADLSPVVEAIQALRAAERESQDLAQLIADPAGDKEMKALAEEEQSALKTRMPELERKVQLMLLPKDEADERNAILEIRAGTGGEEAALFAAALFRMYARYAAL